MKNERLLGNCNLFFSKLNNKTFLVGKKKKRGKNRKEKGQKGWNTRQKTCCFIFFFSSEIHSSEQKNWEHQTAQLAVSHRPDILLRLSCSWTGVAKDCSGQAGQKTAQSLCSENHCRQNLLGLTFIEIILATESSNSEKIAHRGNTLP